MKSTIADVLRPGELRARLGLGRSRFCELQQQGKFRHLENVNVSAALGARVYDRRKVDTWMQAEPAVARVVQQARAHVHHGMRRAG